MIRWLHLTLVSASSLLLALLILAIILKRCFWPQTRKKFDSAGDIERGQSLQIGITKLHQVSPHHPGSTTKSNHYDVSQPTFRWIDHPFLVTEAVENGWSRFAFTQFVLPASRNTARSILGACIRDPGNESRVEIGWEICEGSVDFMQRVELNPDLKKMSTSVSGVRTTLPLPGPNLGNSCFPQEAYFEITILSCTGDAGCDQLSANSGDRIKLIGEDLNKKNSPNSLGQHVESPKLGKHGRKNAGALICVGLTGGGPVLSPVPGRFPGSVGFNSNGCVYLDGTKLVDELEEDEEWGISGCVVGCGYNPNQKKVFFTVDSQLVREIHCKTEEFGSPLYPTVVANTNVSVLVNLGQSLFKYTPANSQRTPNPCFIRPLSTSPSLGYEDSKELFSMGRIDSQWLQRSAIRSNNNTVSSIKDIQYDQESEGDLFEIVLESIGTSPQSILQHSTQLHSTAKKLESLAAKNEDV